MEQNAELFSDSGPFCMNGGCEEGKMTCGKCIPPKMSPSDIIRVDFQKLYAETVLEEGGADEDSTDWRGHMPMMLGLMYSVLVILL